MSESVPDAVRCMVDMWRRGQGTVMQHGARFASMVGNLVQYELGQAVHKALTYENYQALDFNRADTVILRACLAVGTGTFYDFAVKGWVEAHVPA